MGRFLLEIKAIYGWQFLWSQTLPMGYMAGCELYCRFGILKFGLDSNRAIPRFTFQDLWRVCMGKAESAVSASALPCTIAAVEVGLL